MDLTNIVAFDKSLLLAVNGSENLFLDHVVLVFTSGFTWIPLYVALFYLVVKNNERWARMLLIIVTFAVFMALSNAFNAGFVKPFVGRLRPASDPSLAGIVRLADHYTAEGFSFFSSHAFNTFAIATFFTLLVRSKVLSLFLFLWAVLTAWTRLYLGVHYPLDVATGTVTGIFVGVLCYLCCNKLIKHIAPISPYVSTQYTKTGYSLTDIDIVISTIIILCLYCTLRAFIEAGVY